MDTGFAAPACIAPAVLPDEFQLRGPSQRPVRVAGGQPRAAVVLVEILVKGLD